MPAWLKLASPTWEPTPPMSFTSHVWTAAMEAPDTGLWLTQLPPSSTTNQSWMWGKNQITPSPSSFLSLRPGTWSSEYHPHLFHYETRVKNQNINVLLSAMFQCLLVYMEMDLELVPEVIFCTYTSVHFITLIAGRSARITLLLT